MVNTVKYLFSQKGKYWSCLSTWLEKNHLAYKIFKRRGSLNSELTMKGNCLCVMNIELFFFFPIPSKEIWLPVLLSVNWCYVHPFSLFCNSNSAPKSQLLLPTPMLLWPTYAGSSKAAKKTHLCPLQVGPLPMAFAKGLYLPLPVGSSLCQLFDDAILHLLLITGPTAATLHLSVQTSSCKEESYPPAKYWQSASSLDVLFH